MNKMEFDDWYMVLRDLARKHGENVSDREAWREAWEFDYTSPEEAFYSEYPEHRP